MHNVPNTKLGNMYQNHIEYILKKDIESLLDQYADDALLISSFEKVPKLFKGREAIREHLNGIMGIDGLESEVVFWSDTQDPETVMVTEKITMTMGDKKINMRFADSWVIENDKIKIHFAGMVQYPDGTLA
jgi:ketosteroid isomerase-like protein